MSVFCPYENPVFCGKKLNLQPIHPEVCQHYPVYRPKDTIFAYAAWPTVTRDEKGTLYASSSAFATDHVCPFTKAAMYVSKTEGKTWSPPIVLQDSYISDGNGAVIYQSNGRMLIHWGYHPGDVLFNEYYNRIRGVMLGGEPDAMGNLTGAMLDMFPSLPAEKLVGGAFVKVSEDYGYTWSEPVRIPVAAPHGPTVCKDGTLILLGKEFYADPSKTLEKDAFSGNARITAKTYSEYIDKIEVSRAGTECGVTPIYAYASTDGGYTWEKRGLCQKPDHIKWYYTSEPHVIELDDGTLLGAIRVEDEGKYENDYTIYTTRSADGGRTWSAWKCTHICGAPAHLMKHSSGVLICSVGRRTKPDLGEYAYISQDNGETWTKEYVINELTPNCDLGYPCSVELDDGSIFTVYYQKYLDPKTGKYDNLPCIMGTRWTL